ncbi:hypothetical protein CHH28_05815 [Bacterioplanes sanyensis]|uniref:Uncharacterized protein n=1 Tax=Bacterioplanes sanyensis TaxID=1249553 RepID=A0A222FGW5_9GAMM|nr:DUF6776 family protein [Bacterioplanes sanyensis]ASP38228.1 hypothetical protein CHH28_05815 [Bacterioplanes sanyensis]
MAVVKGSQQDRLVIRHYEPGQRVRRFFYFWLTLIVIGAGGYFAGTYQSMETINTLTQQRDSFEGQLLQAERGIEEMTQRVKVLEKGGEVDRQATEGIRQTVRELKAQVSSLEEEVSFYKGIMAPSSGDKGLRVSKMDITTADGSHIDYSIVLTQVADNSSYISGLAAVNVIGQRQGEQVILPLRELDPEITELGIKFRFRYFQEVKGRLSLPDDFQPQKIQVVLQATGSKAQRVERTEEWPQPQGEA